MSCSLNVSLMVARVSDHLAPFKMIELNVADTCNIFGAILGAISKDLSSLSYHGLVKFLFLNGIVFYFYSRHFDSNDDFDIE